MNEHVFFTLNKNRVVFPDIGVASRCQRDKPSIQPLWPPPKFQVVLRFSGQTKADDGEIIHMLEPDQEAVVLVESPGPLPTQPGVFLNRHSVYRLHEYNGRIGGRSRCGWRS